MNNKVCEHCDVKSCAGCAAYDQKRKKVAYVAHPIAGDVAGNLEKVTAIIRKINLEEPDIIPFAHYFVDCHALNDDVPEERERGISNDAHFMNSGLIDELRLYGNRISKGMYDEIVLALQNGVAVKPMTEETRNKWFDMCHKAAELLNKSRL